MYTVAGVTGHVGSAVAEALIARGLPLRVLVRTAEKGRPWAERGADVAVADLHDRPAMAAAMKGSAGAFLLLPVNMIAGDVDADRKAMTEAISGAVGDAGVPHAVVLSALGAEAPDGPELTRWLGEFESAVRATTATVTTVRSGHFQENLGLLLGAVQAGIYPVVADSADAPVTLVATRDLGSIIADALVQPVSSHRIIDVEGPTYTERQVAALLGAALGRELAVTVLPRDTWAGTFAEAGMSPAGADVVARLYAADADGLLRPADGRHVRGWTPIDATIHALVDSLAASAPALAPAPR